MDKETTELLLTVTKNSEVLSNKITDLFEPETPLAVLMALKVTLHTFELAHPKTATLCEILIRPSLNQVAEVAAQLKTQEV